jgi:hypothetical protein
MLCQSENLYSFVQNSEEDIPECGPWAVCSKVDLYETPWVERQCRCPGRQSCPSQLAATDGHTITDKTRQFKVQHKQMSTGARNSNDYHSKHAQRDVKYSEGARYDTRAHPLFVTP